VGLAYPPWKDGELEEIPEDESKKPSSIMHNDIHDENVLLGDVMPNSEEHWLTPILKVQFSFLLYYDTAVICVSIRLTGSC